LVAIAAPFFFALLKPLRLLREPPRANGFALALIMESPA
jgi:hypothetical protein